MTAGLSAPPIITGNRIFETQLDKANALRRATLERNNGENDIPNPWSVPVRQRTPIPFKKHVSLEGAEACTVGVSSTSPGVDGLTLKILKACWPIIGKHVTDLFQRYLMVGYHPKPFKVADVVMIPKLGKKDYSDPRTYRPISLLSCLGKGLERLVGKRLAWTVFERGILAPQHFGALPKRAATDLVAALVHDIEQALGQGLVATLVTADVKVPSMQPSWTESFMTERSARVRFEDTLTEVEPLHCGLPQGSPTSPIPILYMLYTEPICGKLGTRRRRFGYADDIGILNVGTTLQETAAEATEQLIELVDWGQDNGVEFDPAKTEIMHFSRKRDTNNPIVTHGTTRKMAEPSMRWLGVFLDRKLTFRDHVKHWTGKASRVANHIRSLCNTVRGLPVASTRKAVTSCVIPVLTHGLEVRYPGRERTRQDNTTSSCRVKKQLQQMQSVLRTATRAILPVWRTHPSHILHFESQIPPAEILAESIHRRHGFRLGRVDKSIH
ncbi:hypothetical protein TruAng_012328 [Truncatella angustata]|nr:hypothetical protein TruAng_012328 [Truncatella angustata]